MNDNRDILVGIDASLVNCGICILEKGEMTFLSGSLLEMVDALGKKKIMSRIVAVVEDPNKDSTVFGGFYKVKIAITEFVKLAISTSRIPSLDKVESEFRMAMKIAQNIGESKASAKILIQLFERAGVPVLKIAPSSRDRADKAAIKTSYQSARMLRMPTKTNAIQFEEITGCRTRTNEHVRDAAMLVWGRTTRWALMQIP